ncbi:hypothetical protein LINPERHAP1_LOCUS21161 [Linum perenne]
MGVEPPARAISGATVKVPWVKGLFDRLPAGATPEVVTIYARVFTWVLVGAVLLDDRTRDHIPVYLLPLISDPAVEASFSWGSAVLGWLYRVMGREAFFIGGSQKGIGDLGGFTLLVHLLAVERFMRIVERYIEQGAPPVDDSIPRGLRWILSIIAHQKAMRLAEIRYALDWCTEFLMPQQFGLEQRVPHDVESAAPVEQLLAADFRASVPDWVAKYQEYAIL